jgi:hypothetical protein
MQEELPAEIEPEDLPDDPDVLKRLVCDLYATLRASEELERAGGGTRDDADLGWLTQHLAAGGPAGHDPED